MQSHKSLKTHYSFHQYIEHDYIYFNKTNEFTILDKQIFTCLVSTKTEVISLPTVYLMIMQRKKI